MVLTALEKTYAQPQKDITPFQHWFNKNLIKLKEDYMGEFIDGNKEHKAGFMKWCNEQYEK